MRLRYKKYCLRALALIVVAASLGLVAEEMRHTVSSDRESPSVEVTFENERVVDTAYLPAAKIDLESLAIKNFQKPLFDPPPPVVEEPVVAPPPALDVHLLGTIINTTNSQAIVKDRQGRIGFRSLGQPVSSDHPSSSIEEILPATIKVRRGEHLDTVSVE